MADSGKHSELDIRHTIVHTNGMKIAISIPESVFRDVKEAAEKQKRSRSAIFVEAVKDYLTKIESHRILDTLNEVYAAPETDEERDARRSELDLYKRTVLKKEEW
jgi:metal-responsive CopG/Arc/MetJ family transcriptional regulator